jgi:hypothetical protein
MIDVLKMDDKNVNFNNDEPSVPVARTDPIRKKEKVYLPSLRMKVPDHVYVFGSLLLQ